MLKSSFSIFEVILSLSILSLVIGGFVSSSLYDTNNSKLFTKLNNLENDFNTKDYESMTKSIANLRVFINDKEKNIKVYKYTFEDKDIKLIKYEK